MVTIEIPLDRLKDLVSMMIVGALWGCTNPLLRKGSVEATQTESSSSKFSSKKSFLRSSLNSFLNIKVWLPYVLNQSGSIVYYLLLAKSDLSLAVPICNAMALLFSFATSTALGEPILNPVRTFLGAALVVLGVASCVATQEAESILEGEENEL